jgi:hypothetical protein
MVKENPAQRGFWHASCLLEMIQQHRSINRISYPLLQWEWRCKMLRLSRLCYISFMGSIILLIFQGIASVLNEEFAMKDLRLINFINAGINEWAADITLFSFNNLFDYLVNLQMFVFLFILSVVFFILSSVFERGRI